MQIPIFGISGLRGIVGDGLLPETVVRHAAAFGTFVGHGTVAVGRDCRASGEMMHAAAVAGLVAVGCEVMDLGVCPTPTVVHVTRRGTLAGALMLTASHNPEQWNGMKFVSREGQFLSPEEVAAFRKLLKGKGAKYAVWEALRPVKANPNAVYAHVNSILSHELFRSVRPALIARKLKVGVDAVNGAASVAACQLVEALGAEPVRLYCSIEPMKQGATFPRKPEPAAQNLGDLSSLVRERKLDLGIAFDPDGDRFSCVDETGTPLGEEATICLACKYVLPQRKGPVVVNLSTTRAVDDVCDELGVTVERTAVGEANVADRMAKVQAVLGGEGNGGVILPELNFTRDGLVAAATVIGLVSQGSQPLSAIGAALPKYQMVKTTMALSGEQLAERDERLVKAFEGAQVDRQDGFKFSLEDSWVHVRSSNTEPIVRIIAEAKTGAQAKAMVERVRQTLSANSKEPEKK
ncbi:phosphoglucosamine mutase [candidate division WOR-3 bacterium]|nr:phosphoglucosamine mutase [candidate division WOR-3 bacterium]